MNDYVYVFLHMPKTGGSTISYHIVKNLKKHERLNVTHEDLGLDSQNPSFNKLDYQKGMKNFFLKIDKDRLNKIKVIYGHTVPYGVHKYIKKPVRYVTFVRNPITRAVSLYNHLKYHYKKGLDGGQNIKYYKLAYLIKGKEPSFLDWLRYKFNSDELHGYLTMFGYLSLMGYVNDKNIEKGLKKFFLIGTIETFETDATLFYELLGFKKYFIPQNISYKYITPEEGFKYQDIIFNKNRLSLYLYNYASFRRSNFIKNNFNLFNFLWLKMFQIFLSRPFTQLVFSPRNAIKHYLKMS